MTMETKQTTAPDYNVEQLKLTELTQSLFSCLAKLRSVHGEVLDAFSTEYHETVADDYTKDFVTKINETEDELLNLVKISIKNNVDYNEVTKEMVV